jgi:hypothetical protein
MLRKNFILLTLILLFVDFHVLCEADDKIISELETKFPCYKQPDSHTCGPTSAAMLLNYYGVKIDINTLKLQARTSYFNVKIPGTAITLFKFKKDDWGYTHPDHLLDALNRHIRVIKKEGALGQDIVNAIDNNKPVIVLVRSNMTTFHYFVIVGYEIDRSIRGILRWIIIDTDGRRAYRIENRYFLPSWQFSPTSYVDGTKYEFKCDGCKGDGHAWTKCVTCSGTGKWSATILGKKMWTKCTACSGTGKWSSKCPLCLGQGKFPDFVIDAVKLAGAKPCTVFIPRDPPSFISSQNSLSGTWKSGNNTLAISKDGRFTLYVSGKGQKSYYYDYSPLTGTLTAKDARNKVTNISVQWIDNDHIRWMSPNGTKVYQRK